MDEKIKKTIFEVDPNLLFILCGVFTSVSINLLTTLFTSKYHSFSFFFYIISVLASIYSTITFCKLTFKVVEINERIKKDPDSQYPDGLKVLQDDEYLNNGKLIRNLINKITISFLLFFISLVIGYILLNLSFFQEEINKYIIQFNIPIRFILEL